MPNMHSASSHRPHDPAGSGKPEALRYIHVCVYYPTYCYSDEQAALHRHFRQNWYNN